MLQGINSISMHYFSSFLEKHNCDDSVLLLLVSVDKMLMEINDAHRHRKTSKCMDKMIKVKSDIKYSNPQLQRWPKSKHI